MLALLGYRDSFNSKKTFNITVDQTVSIILLQPTIENLTKIEISSPTPIPQPTTIAHFSATIIKLLNLAGYLC